MSLVKYKCSIKWWFWMTTNQRGITEYEVFYYVGGLRLTTNFGTWWQLSLRDSLELGGNTHLEVLWNLEQSPRGYV